MTSAAPAVALVDRPDAVRAALSPIRTRMLARLRRPASATMVAEEMGLARQRVNYHLRALEAAGLLILVEERQRRGCVERILVARARAFVVDPAVMSGTPKPSAAVRQDRFAAAHLIAAAADIMRDVTRMQTRAAEQGARLLTFTLDTEIAFASPAEFERFSSELAAHLAHMASAFHQRAGGRRYRIVAGAHPAPKSSSGSQA
jgi:DNA-binding transcriptional ArsR family regulator